MCGVLKLKRRAIQNAKKQKQKQKLKVKKKICRRWLLNTKSGGGLGQEDKKGEVERVSQPTTS